MFEGSQCPGKENFATKSDMVKPQVMQNTSTLNMPGSFGSVFERPCLVFSWVETPGTAREIDLSCGIARSVRYSAVLVADV